MSELDQLFRQMAVGDLARMAGRPVGDIVAHALKGNLHKAPGASRRTPKQAATRRGQGVNTRTREGRAAYDAAILAFLQGQDEECSADAIRKKVGGTAAQVRSRLKAIKGVKRSGRARATVYWVR